MLNLTILLGLEHLLVKVQHSFISSSTEPIMERSETCVVALWIIWHVLDNFKILYDE